MSLQDIYNQKKEEDEVKTRSQIKIEESQSKDKFNRSNFIIMLSVSIAMALFTGWQIKKLWLDDSILAFQCSSTPSLDASVRLSRLDKSSDQDLEHLVRGFIRRYIRARYPKNSKEAKYMWKYIADNSSGTIRDNFLGRIQELDEFGKELDEGNVVSVYPVNSKLITIRETSSGVWEVRVPIRRVNVVGTVGDERTEPVISMTIEAGEASYSGSNSGLTVSSYKVVYTPDTISGKEIILE